MPAYELFLIVRDLPRPELVKTIKRGAEVILKKNGIIRSFENLGLKNLPYKMKTKDAYQTTGNYILVKFDIPSSQVRDVKREVGKDADYLRSHISPLLEYDESYQVECICKDKGQFIKNGFDFMKPMTVWDKKKHFKNYGLRL